MGKKFKRFFNSAIRFFEFAIAVITLLVLLALIVFEVMKFFTVDSYFASADVYLKNMLTILVGLEFVRMLINLTAANTIEVLIVAIARTVIVDHHNALSTVACVLCIAGLFAIRKFLLSENDVKKELEEQEAMFIKLSEECDVTRELTMIFEIVERINEIAKEEQVSCVCGSHAISIEIDNEKITLKCRDCGKVKDIPSNEESLEMLLNTSAIVLD